MESTVKGNRKPVSLNYRHYRQLQDMSSTQPKYKSFVDNEERNEDMKSPALQGKFKSALQACTNENNFEAGDCGGPCFSGITDFDSPLATLEETNDKVIHINSCDSYGIVMEENSLTLPKIFAMGVDSSGISDTNSDGGSSSLEKKSKVRHMSDADPHSEDDNYDTERSTMPSLDSLQECCNQGQRMVNLEDHQSAMACPITKFERDIAEEFEIISPKSCSLSDDLNYESSGVECLESAKEKLTKVKLEGRRRLCKYKAPTQESVSSPIVTENGCQYDEFTETNPGAGEIRDIINELNTKMGHLSIEKSKTTITASGDIPLNEDTDSASDEVMIIEHIAPNEANFLFVDDVSRNQYNGSVFDPNNTMRGDMKKMRGNATHAVMSFVSKIKDTDDVQVIKVRGNNVKPSNRHNQSTNLLKLGSANYENDDTTSEADCFALSGTVSCFKLPSKLANFLYPHQRDGLQWLWSLHCLGKGGILGDDMGLGKTMQICAFLAGLFHSKLIKRALIVAPKTLLSHWMKELSTVGLIGMTREYYGTSKSRDYELQYILQDKGVLLTTYDIVRNNWKSLKGNGSFLDEDSYETFRWDYMILDEGHLIKNPSTQRAKSLLELPCTHRVVISGTPIQNNLKELWALFNFCCPGLLGDNKGFKEKYEQFILKGNEKNASDRDKRIGSTVAKDLRDKIQPYFLRRMKNDVFKGNDLDDVKLSKKNEIIVWLKLTNCQRQLYEAFLQSELVLSAFDGSPLAALTILKKICDHPLLLTKRAAEDVLEGMDSMLSHEDASLAEKLAKHVADTADRSVFEEKHGSISCKISFIMSLLHDLLCDGHRILIFSQTRKMLNIIQDLLLTNGYEFMRIDGTTKASDRVKIVDEFQMGHGAPIFLLTSQVGGLGLTLTRADRVIVVDPAWNPSTDNQSVDRAYRIGQKNDVVVYRLMTCGTVEEKIYRKQIFKGGLFKSATEHKEQIRYFSQQDLRELFSLPKQGFDISLTQKQLHEEHDSQHVMDETFVNHIKFLETLGIAGVSHHNLLFSKTMPAQYVTEEEAEELRRLNRSVTGMTSSSTLDEVDVDGAKFAFDPKDSVWKKKVASPNNEGNRTEADIKEKITRLSQIVNSKNTLMKLPDQGAKIVKQIEELKSELYKVQIEGTRVDDITNHLDKVLTF